MTSKKLKIKFVLTCRATKSIMKGVTFVEGESYHLETDGMTKHLTSCIPKFLKKHHGAEDPAKWDVEKWELVGFCDWHEWAKRKALARSNCNA